ncbi:hypothetical protein BKA93DRAFT_138253 [Sparassis latifolia]
MDTLLTEQAQHPSSHNALPPPLSGIARFPEELWMNIIDFLQDDRKALRACNLTCRAWVSSARRHLFRSFKVRWGSDCDHLGSLIERGLAPLIRDLTIDVQMSAYLTFLDDPLPELLQELWAVEALHFKLLIGSFPSCISAETAQTILTSFPAMNTMTVDGWVWPADSLIATMTLHAVTVHMSRNRVDDALPLSQAPSDSECPADKIIEISELGFADSASGDKLLTGILVYLLYAPFKVNVRRLEWNSHGSQGAQNMLAHVLHRADTLQHCHIAFSCLAGPRQIRYLPEPMADIRFAHLISLHLQYNMDYWPGPMHGWGPYIISQVHSPHLQELRITFQGHLADQFHGTSWVFDWDTFDGELARLHAISPRFFVLFSLKIRDQDMALWERWVTEAITTRLPRARASRVQVGLACPNSPLPDDSASTGAGEDSMSTQWLL